MDSITLAEPRTKPICWHCRKPICIDPFLGFKENHGGYICLACKRSLLEWERDDRIGKRNCIIAACIGIIAFCYVGYRHFTVPPPAPPTAEERIQAARLAKIDAA